MLKPNIFTSLKRKETGADLYPSMFTYWETGSAKKLCSQLLAPPNSIISEDHPVKVLELSASSVSAKYHM